MNGNGHFDPMPAMDGVYRDEVFYDVEDEHVSLDTIDRAEVEMYEVNPEANFRCGREIVEGQFSILKLRRMNLELRLTDDQRMQVQDLLTSSKSEALYAGFVSRTSKKNVSEGFKDSHKRFMDEAALRSAEIESEIGNLKKRRNDEREEAISAAIDKEAGKITTAQAAHEEIVLRNMRLARVRAIRHGGYSALRLLDLIQYAKIGLMTAAAMYDYEVGQFSTYAHPWAVKFVQLGIAEEGPITLSRTMRAEQTRNLKMIGESVRLLGRELTDDELDQVLIGGRKKFIEEKTRRLGRAFTDEELGAVLAEVKAKYFDFIRAQKIDSLNWTVSLDGDEVEVELGDTIADKGPAVDEVAMRFMLGSAVRMVLNEVLTPREYKTLDLRFGISDGRSRTRDEAGKEIGITGEGIRKREEVIFERLKKDGRLERLYELV